LVGVPSAAKAAWWRAFDGRVETLPFRKKSPAAVGLRRVALREFSHLSFAKVGHPVWWLKERFFLREAHSSEARRGVPGLVKHSLGG